MQHSLPDKRWCRCLGWRHTHSKREKRYVCLLSSLYILACLRCIPLPICLYVYYTGQALTPSSSPPGFCHHAFLLLQLKFQVDLSVNKLTSVKTQMPYDYYSLPYCKPATVKLDSENVGEALAGDRNENSDYKLNMKENKECEVLCSVTLKKEDSVAFVHAIDDEYRVHWIVDNLPVGIKSMSSQNEAIFERGFPVGFHTGKKGKDVAFNRHYVNNHVRIIVEYNDDEPVEGEEITSKIIGFRAEPRSIKHGGATATPGGILTTCAGGGKDEASYQTVDTVGDTVVFTYDVVWEATQVPWSHRWDAYMAADASNDKIHWFSITNSIMVVLFLTVMIAMILIRALRKDIAQYNDPASLEEAKEETGWKLVHGDVFRPPTTAPMLLSVLVGTGVQLFWMSLFTLTFAVAGLLSPANRGSIVTGLVLLFVFMGSMAGYYSSTTYKMFRGLSWKENTFYTAFLFPGTVFLIMGTINAVLWVEGSSGALPFSTFFTLLFLWFCVSVPLVFLGSFYGYKREVDSFPVRTNQIPRQIPVAPWYTSAFITCMVAGVLPFAAVSVELYFIMSALWLHHIYYIFGFLFLVMCVLIATCAEISILLCYVQLCNEDYNWWWRSFFTSGSCSVYMMLYAVWYNMTELNLEGFVPVMIYFGYMGILSLSFFLLTGTVGFFSCYWFNIKIYNSIKVD